jgi:5'-nucleotidase
MADTKPLILVTNDDGITAHGIRTLVSLMEQVGRVVVVAPNSPQSGMGHAITISNPLRLYPTDIYGETPAWECSGTPADCVKIAKHHVLRDRAPDLVVSGINHGANTAISVLYSGTMSAAIEGALEGIPAIGFSLADFSRRPDFSHTHAPILTIVRAVLARGLPDGTALNVNFPLKTAEPLRGIKLCRQARARWKEDFAERHDPHGRRYFWLDGAMVNPDTGDDTDEAALAQNYVSVVPCQYDMTNYTALNVLNDWNLSIGE